MTEARAGGAVGERVGGEVAGDFEGAGEAVLGQRVAGALGVFLLSE